MELCFISISLYSDVKNTTSFKRYGYWRKTRFFFPVMANKKPPLYFTPAHTALPPATVSFQETRAEKYRAE
jgi:hypothetical protein